jgi:serine/threonine protein kinase
MWSRPPVSSDAPFNPYSNAYPNALPAGTRIRDYTIVSVIGIGGFSIVYKAMDTALMREVAIKEYFPGGISLRENDGSVHSQPREAEAFRKGIESFLNEGKLLAQFDHPALVRVYRFWEERGTAYLAMRLYSGVTLKDSVKSGTWSANAQTLPALLLPMCEALEVLHAARCYHRDVAPDNILLGENNWPVLLDFGAARKAIEGTQVFTAILKPGYAPIEQYGDGELQQGPWTDIYALAGVVHFTLSGDPPPTAISRMLRDSMPRPREAFAGRLPERWLDAMETSLAVKPENRPQSVAEFISLMGWDDLSAPVVDLVTQEMRAAAVQPEIPPSVSPAPTPVTTSSPPFARPSPPAPTPAISSSAATVMIDNERTIIAPRAATRPAPSPTARVADSVQPQPRPERAGPERAPYTAGKWIGVVAGVVGAVFLAWWLLSGSRSAPAVSPDKSPNTTETSPKVPPPVAAPTIILQPNDASVPAKTSLPVEAPPAEVTAAPAKVPSEPKIEVVQPERKVETRSTTRAPRVDRGQAEPRESSRRPARCSGLIDRWQLGAALSDEEQRFLTETCK